MARSPHRRGDRSLGLTIFIGLVLLSVLGLVFSVAQGSQRITSAAGALHTTDETLRTATVARAQIALAVHLASVDRELGTNSSSAIALSAEESRLALADFETGVGHLRSGQGSDVERLSDAADRFTTTVHTIEAGLLGNDLETAQRLSSGPLGPEFQVVADLLVALRDDLADEVAASDALLGRVGNISRYLVAFLIPAAVVIVYRGLLRRQQRQAELESRLESERQLSAAREAFIANASHELRTPLTSIVGLSILLAEKESIQHDPDAAEVLDIVISESDDLARMVEDLLTTARLDSGALHYAFDDVDVAEEILEITDTLHRGGLDIAAECEAAVVRADRLRLRQVLRNLLSNARKYGGPEIRISGRIEGRTYVCTVIDNGQGIPDEIVPRLFKRFIHQGHQTATKDSVGLGLSIVHALTQGMGGSIQYERIDGNTHFSMRMPLVDGEAPSPETASEIEPEAVFLRSAAERS